ncbi:MAG: Glutamine synthetase [Chlamydiales bacterium]|nr:Glutamine synthetase [Chlamydiales bacterium]MCH9620221.1 Glutamine synthetase [Chlamydiales bacterium]MCH9623064.1 Glutamine synthetase [Chlamydiales bacterium]
MTPREDAVSKISKRKYPEQKRAPFAEVFGENLFHEGVQKEMLSSTVFEALQKTVNQGDELKEDVADKVAAGIRKWAIGKGATHFSHWFQPLTDLTAEKHDALFEPDGKGGVVAAFSGAHLTRGEPDASSFPSGGLRTTFEARGYTAWDPASPPFLIDRTLVIPTIFLSWTGDALDKKTPLLRSMDALNLHALRVLRLFKERNVHRVFPTVGAEQEYFLIDKHFYYLRPDLIATGRTLFGAKPSKGQELEDQYLGTIPERVLRVMEEAEYELIRLGVPVQTRHNEVAPGQYEIAVRFEVANLAADHQMIVMEILKSVAARHEMSCLLHEKPFAQINGSGKHNNWSLSTDTGHNLLDPGTTPQENAEFLLFCSAVALAVYRHSSLLLLSIASAGNDHRLGQHEAPPGILSLFFGSELFAIFKQLVAGKKGGDHSLGKLKIGVSRLPKIPRHSSDRNRTSPFAFTGNKFEFRAVGSSANISRPNIFLNTMVAQTLDEFATKIERGVKGGGSFAEELNKVITEAAKEFMPILFEGDNYDAKWHTEAKRRKLPQISNTVDAASLYTSKEALSLFTKYKVFSKKELESREEILLKKYIHQIRIEGNTASMMGHTMIQPAVIQYLNEVDAILPAFHAQLTKELNAFIKVLKHLDDALASEPAEELKKVGGYMRDKIFPLMEELRCHGDRLEGLIDDHIWPLPKYREMLFIR